MSSPLTRRDFVANAAALGAVAAAGDFAFLGALPALSAQDVQPRRAMAQLAADVEPLVRFVEDTPRERLLEGVAERIRGGIGYQQLLAALMLAGVRGIQPRPVGFKFHAVLVVNSAHLASLAATDQDRWLPLFWALDNYKVSQKRNRIEGGWVMAPPAENQLPTAQDARRRFTEAMDNWDVEGADRAITTLARTGGANDVIEIFWRYGGRDFRDIGHKIIYVANGWRTLQTIGWRHAEPVLRSLAYALLEHEGSNPAQRDDDRDRPGRDNLAKAGRIRAGWQRGRISSEAATDLLGTLRTATPAEASDRVVEILNRETDPASIWDGLFLTAGELLMRQPGIVGLHTLTTMNAMHFAWQTAQNDETRRWLMLQAASFLPMFRAAMGGRGQVGSIRVDTLERANVQERVPDVVEEIFADVSRDKLSAARKTLGLLEAHPESAGPIMAAARRLIFTRGTDSHDYKFSSAVLEDYHHATAALRNRFLAASMYWLKGSGGRDTDLVRRTRAALGNGG
ncbi:MAG: hypothetical protein HY040_21650 [Planctomycetes bacterium]|nr:hypothetical protein [Planctomycetota bacterium]